MMKNLKVDTPQFKTQFIRKLKNVFPDCEIELIENIKRGIGFRLKDNHGQYRSNVVRIHRNYDNLLSKENLIRLVKIAGQPNIGD